MDVAADYTIAEKVAILPAVYNIAETVATAGVGQLLYPHLNPRTLGGTILLSGTVATPTLGYTIAETVATQTPPTRARI